MQLLIVAVKTALKYRLLFFLKKNVKNPFFLFTNALALCASNPVRGIASANRLQYNQLTFVENTSG
jgi:hypothetical protein